MNGREFIYDVRNNTACRNEIVENRIFDERLVRLLVSFLYKQCCCRQNWFYIACQNPLKQKCHHWKIAFLSFRNDTEIFACCITNTIFCNFVKLNIRVFYKIYFVWQRAFYANDIQKSKNTLLMILSVIWIIVKCIILHNG